MKTRLMEAKPGQYKVQCILPGRGVACDKTGDVGGNLKLDPSRRSNWTLHELYLPLTTLFETGMTAFFNPFFESIPLKRPSRLRTAAFRPKHPKRNQNPRFIPLSETTSSIFVHGRSFRV